MDLNDFDLPFATDNAIELSGGSRSKGYRVGDYIVRIPLREDSLTEQKREAEISALMHADGYLAAANCIGVGGDHISSDIAYAFQTTHAQSEDLKKKEASAVLLPSGSASARVQIPGSSPLIETRTISRRALDTVVNLRLKELFSIIRHELEDQDLLHRLHSGIVLTGGGAALKGLDALVQKEFGLPARIGRPIHVDGLSDVENQEAFAAIAGALMYAHKNYETKPFFSIFKGFFK